MVMKRLHIAVIVLFVGLTVSCNVTKYVPPGDALFRGSSIKVEGTGIPKQKKKQITVELNGITSPRPNSRFLGVPFKLMIYNIVGPPDPKDDPENKGGIKRWIRSMGEPPVLLSDVNLQATNDVLTNHMENRGFFQAKTVSDTIVKKKKATANYFVAAGPEYTINEVFFPDDTSVLAQSIARTAPKTLLKKGDPYNLAIIKLERTRIDVSLKENGFYYFGPDYLLLHVDSTIGNAKVNMYVRIKPETPAEAKNVYTINNIFVYPNYRINTAQADTNRNHMELYNGYYVVDRRKLYKPSLFAQAMQFQNGDVYNRTEHNLTLNRLINLNIFKFVKNRFDDVSTGEGDARLNAMYYLTPHPRKSIKAEVAGSTKTNNMTGSQVVF